MWHKIKIGHNDSILERSGRKCGRDEVAGVVCYVGKEGGGEGGGVLGRGGGEEETVHFPPVLISTSLPQPPPSPTTRATTTKRIRSSGEPWADWSPCSVSCGEGYQERSRSRVCSRSQHCDANHRQLSYKSHQQCFCFCILHWEQQEAFPFTISNLQMGDQLCLKEF